MIFSDSVVYAVARARNRFYYNESMHRIAFHAIDACKTPLGDNSVDIILGYSVVHHLGNLDMFFEEIHRILKDGGYCLFYDSAYSKLWQNAKSGLLRWVVKYSHKKWGVSPMDIVATRRGGYSEKEIQNVMNYWRFSGMTYKRFGLIYQVFNRGVAKLFGTNAATNAVRSIFIPLLFHIDSFLSKISKRYHNNTINLIWGLRK